MGKIIIQEYTTKNPIQMIGFESGVCYGADITDFNRNYKRGLENLQSQHGRTFEFPQVYMTIDGYSARVIREFYTHIAGGPTRLQASTRYIKYGAFEFIIPPSIEANEKALEKYIALMNNISETYRALEELGIPKEDIANILPLGMETTIVVRTNFRNLVDMSHQRMCNRAYWEYRKLMDEMCLALSEYSEEWKYLIDNYFQPKCQFFGKCTEAHPCYEKKNI